MKIEFRKFLKDKYKILVLAVFIFAVIIRIMNWPNGIEAINCDEAMMAINAKSIAKTGNDIYGVKLPIYFETWLIGGQSALPTYLVALSIRILGNSLLAIRLPILVFSLISLWIIYVLTKKLFNNKIAIIVLFLTAINPWHIMQSQWNLDCNLFPHIILIAVYLLYKGIDEKKIKSVYLSMIFFALSMYCYGISIYFVPIFLLIIGIYLLKNKYVTIKEFILSLLIYLIISIPILMMYIINFLKLDTIEILGFTIQRFSYLQRSNDMLIFSHNILYQLKTNIISLIRIIILQNDGYIWNSINKFGCIYLQSIIFVSIAIVSLLSNKRDKESKMILLNWFAISLIIGILINEININRINIIWYPLIILTGYGINEISELIKSKWGERIIIFVYIVSFILFGFKYYTTYQYKISNAYTFDKGLVKACEFINHVDEKNIIVSKEINTAGEWVYYRYALEHNYENPISRYELVSYYIGNKEKIDWFNNGNKEYNTVDLQKEKKLDANVYLIRVDEKNKIENLNDYHINEFGKYLVLIKTKGV